MKKRKTDQFEEAKLVKEIEVSDPDEHDFLFYHSPDFKLLYIFVLDEHNEKVTPANFRKLFPKAKNVSEKEFEHIYHLNPDAEVITVATDSFIDNFMEDD
jgi:hypothetical protein